MRLALLAGLVAVTSPAFAEVDAECNVRVIKAPKHVRAAIEARVGIEADCTPLEVRVVKKRRVYQVTARTDDGEVHQASARDAGRIAELVMTWAAPAAEPAPVAEAAPAAPAVAEAPPAEINAPIEELGATDRIVIEPASRESGRDLGVGVLATPITYGIRAEADILAWHGFALGVAFGASDSIWSTGDAMTGASIDLRDFTGGAFAAKTFGTGAWRLRMQAGIGFVYTQYTAKTRTAPFQQFAAGDGTTRMIDASLTLSRELSSGWAVSIGPLMTYYAQTFTLDAMRAPTREYDVGGYLAIKKRL